MVEVSPAYDHAEITAIAAAHVLYELVTLMARCVRSTEPEFLRPAEQGDGCNSAFISGKPAANVAPVG